MSLDKKSEFITKTKANRENDIYLFGLEYLTDVYLLSILLNKNTLKKIPEHLV